MIYLLNERYDGLRYTRQIKRDANALTAIIGRRRCRHPQTRLRLVGWLVGWLVGSPIPLRSLKEQFSLVIPNDGKCQGEIRRINGEGLGRETHESLMTHA